MASSLQYSYLENFMDRGAWQAAAHRVTKSRTWLKWLNAHACTKPTSPLGAFLPWASGFLLGLHHLGSCHLKWKDFCLRLCFQIHRQAHRGQGLEERQVPVAVGIPSWSWAPPRWVSHFNSPSPWWWPSLGPWSAFSGSVSLSLSFPLSIWGWANSTAAKD